MRDAIATSLAALEGRVGKVDSFVMRSLGWTEANLAKYLAAEQVDGVALALDQISQRKALVIGDQTGIGKGRQVASAIRFALLQGMVPVFVTEKPNLFADMYRDLSDIGQKDIRPLATSNSLKLALDEDETLFLTTPDKKKHEQTLAQIARTGDLGEYNMVFTTYTQMQTVKGEGTARMNMLQALGPRAMLILDESHNAGGQEESSRGGGEEDGGKTGRAGFVRGMVDMAQAVVYSSATWAKRPDVMDLYSKTDMALAVEGKTKLLAGAIARGGVPLQQAVSSMLARAGQYIRREKSFDGIEYNTTPTDVDLDVAEALSAVMLSVRMFDTAKESAVKALAKTAKAEAKLVTGDGSTGTAGAKSTNFTSLMHNLIDQMLLALKAQAAVDRALARRAEGKKVVLTVSSTMGSFIGEYAKIMDLKPGDSIAVSFKDLMMRYLERSRDVTIKDANGRKTRRRMTDAELGGVALRQYNATRKLIQSSDLIGKMPISPIDYIHNKLRQAGVKTGEITGRKETIDYSDSADAVYRVRPAKETKADGRRSIINAFNRGDLDMLILNQAGSTGLSLHASSKFKDKTQRWMLIVQAEKNIDTHMQMLGRINRTGQVILPGYDQLTANVPAEKRPAAVLAKKMASLNANTTAARGSAVTSKDTVDFLNEYGDEVVAQLMADMPDVHEKLGEPLDNAESGEGFEREDAARKVTGRIPLLPVSEQEALYDLIESGYKAALAQADALGENALEAKTYDLGARTTQSTVLFEGDGSSSPFAQGAHLEEVNVKRLGKPYTSQQVQHRVAEEIGQPLDSTWRQLQYEGGKKSWELRQQTMKESAVFREALDAKMLAGEVEEKERLGRLNVYDGQARRWADISGRLQVGHSYALQSGENRLYGTLLSVTKKKGVKLPVALGSWEAHFAIADASRSLTLPFSRIAVSTAGIGEIGKVQIRQAELSETGKPIVQMFDDGQNESREDRIIVTGNLLAGFAKVKGGMIVNYTTSKGGVRQGILMPRNFDLEAFAEDQPVELRADLVVPFFNEAPQAIVSSTDGKLSIRKLDNDYMVVVPKSKSGGGDYFLDRGLTNITGDFSSKGDKMIARVSGRELEQALQHLAANGMKFQTKEFILEAKLLGGKQMASTKAAREEEDEGDMALGDAIPAGEKTLPLKAMRDHVAKLFENSEILPAVVDDENLTPFQAEALARMSAKNRKRWRGYAFTAPNGKRVVLVRAGRYRSLADLERTLIHEAFHHGIKQTIPAFGQYAQNLFGKMGRETFEPVISTYFDGGKAFDQNNPAHVERAVNEYMAKVAEAIEAGNASPRLHQIMDAFLAWLQKALNKMGFRMVFTKAEMRQAVRDSVGTALRGRLDPVDSTAQAMGFSFDEDQQAAEATKNWFVENLTSQPIDKAFRLLVTPFGTVKKGVFTPHGPIKRVAAAASGKATEMASKGFSWLNPTLQHGARTLAEHLKQGFGDRVGTPKEFIEREEQKLSEIRKGLRELQVLGEQLLKSGMSKEETHLLQKAMTGEVIDDEALKAIAGPVIDGIEELGRQLVDLKMLTAEVWEENRRKYLHRSYLRKETAFAGDLVKWVDKKMDARRARIQGDVFRGRGIFEKVSTETLQKSVPPDFWGKSFDKAKADILLKGSKWRMLDRVVSPSDPAQMEAVTGTSGRKDRVLQRIYWPADRELPAKYAGYKDRGTFEVRDVSPQHATIWRDYTPEERMRMGEILDARYNIVKTYSLMIKDLAEGRFFADIAKNPEWAQSTAPTSADGSQNWTEAREVGLRHWTYAGKEWVKVPDTKIGNTNVKRYGQLAGMYVKAPIWRDIAELEYLNTPGAWKTMLRQWKTNKTARSPTVHMNNVMSNFVLMDLHDIRMRDFWAGLQSYLKKDQNYEDAFNHGLFGNNALDKDIREKILKPIIEELLAASKEAGPGGRFAAMHRITDAIHGAFKGLDNFAQLAYQAEDEVFRMGAYMKLLGEGQPAFRAAAEARRQFIDYDIRAPYVNALRNTVLPFISYTYRAVPLVAEAIAKRPWKLAKYYTIAYALQAAAYAMMGEDDDDQDKQRRLMDEQYQGKTWIGVDRMLRIPFNDRYGNPLYFDVRRWIPAADIADTNGDIIEWLPQWMQLGGPVVLGTELALNRNLFYDEDIYEDIDSRTESLGKVGLHLMRGYLPNVPFLPSYSQQNITSAMGLPLGGRQFNAQGEQKSLGREVLGSIGVKVRSQSIEGNERRLRADYKAYAADLSRRRSELNRQYARGNMTEPAYDKEIEEIEEKRQKKFNHLMETLEGEPQE